MPDRPKPMKKRKYLDIHPGSDVPSGDVVADRLRDVFKKLIRPRVPDSPK